MGGLAKPARRFILANAMSVRCYLKKKNQGQQSKRKRQRSGNSPHGFMRKPLHSFIPPSEISNSPMRPRNSSENTYPIVSVRCEPLQEGFASRYSSVHPSPALSGPLPAKKETGREPAPVRRPSPLSGKIPTYDPCLRPRLPSSVPCLPAPTVPWPSLRGHPCPIHLLPAPP
jgi:hypothetical protein